jgi:hypothetical protein
MVLRRRRSLAVDVKAKVINLGGYMLFAFVLVGFSLWIGCGLLLNSGNRIIVFLITLVWPSDAFINKLMLKQVSLKLRKKWTENEPIQPQFGG